MIAPEENPMFRTIGRPLAALGALLAAAVLAGCGSGDGATGADWLRDPLEVALVPGEPPQIVYTVAVDSRDSHETALMVAPSNEEVVFDVAAVSDANGNAPALPGTKVATAYWLWGPRVVVLGERTHVLAIAEDEGGTRQLQRASWEETPGEDLPDAVSGSPGVVAFDVVPCDADACVVLARTGDGASTELVLSRFDSAGEEVGDQTTLASVDGVVRSLHVVRDDAADPPALDVLALACEGCGDVTWDAYEEDIYAVTSRVVHVRAGLDGAAATEPATVFEWGGLVEPASATAWQDGAALLYWRTSATDAPGCTDQGHCPIERSLVLGLWSRTADYTESAPLARSELAYLQGVTASPDRLWALWREGTEEDPYLRELKVADVSDGADATGAGATNLTRSYAPLVARSDRSDSPAALPFDFVDGLAALPTAGDGPWIALRFRDLPPGGPDVCGDAVRVGVWTAQLSEDGLVGPSSPDKDSLRREPTCGGGGCSAGPGAPGGAGALAGLAVLLGLTAAALRLRRQG